MSEQVAVADLQVDEVGTVVRIHGGRGVRRRLRALGIRPGVTVRKVSAALGPGAVVVQVGRSQAALGYGVAHKVIVETQR